MRNLRWRLGLKGCLAVGSNGNSGGIALFWEESISVSLLGMSDRLIDVHVQENPTTPPWRISFIYGEPRVENRNHMWELLQQIKTNVADPWVVMGDFNEAMWQYEHFSNRKRGEKQMEDFRIVLDECDLHDLGFAGLPWTFDNKRGGQRNVKVRLDRVVASTSWSSLFGDASVQHLVSPCSDHCPIMLRVYCDPLAVKKQIRRYEIMWERDSSLEPEIEETWRAAGAKQSLGDVSQALQKR
jgi:hypothetical protein